MKLTRQEILDHCNRAAAEVATWPKWQQDILENSLRPQWDTPREVVWLHSNQPVGDWRNSPGEAIAP